MYTTMDVIKNLYKHLLRLIKLMIFVLAVSLIIVVFSSVISRYFLNASIAWAEEVSRFIFVWVVFLGSILLNDTYSHMNLDILVIYLPKKAKLTLQVISSIFVIVILIFLTKGGYILTVEGLDFYSPAIGFPYGVVNSIMLFAFVIMLLQSIARLLLISSELIKELKN